MDLSIPLGPGTPIYPGDPVPHLEAHSTIERDGFHLLRVTMGSQSGTHADAPYHFRDDGPRIDEVDLSLFVGPGVVVDATGVGERQAIQVQHLDPVADLLRPGVVLLFRTGWSVHAGTPRYRDHPYLAEETARRLLTAGVRTVGIDALSVDETPDDAHPGAGYPAHHLLAGAGAVIVENLAALDRVHELCEPWICAFPVRLEGADGAPVRAVAIEFGVADPVPRSS